MLDPTITVALINALGGAAKTVLERWIPNDFNDAKHKRTKDKLRSALEKEFKSYSGALSVHSWLLLLHLTKTQSHEKVETLAELVYPDLSEEIFSEVLKEFRYRLEWQAHMGLIVRETKNPDGYKYAVTPIGATLVDLAHSANPPDSDFQCALQQQTQLMSQRDAQTAIQA